LQKTLDDIKKENRETSNSDSNLVNPRIVNDIPLIGEPPIEAEPNFNKKRPVRDPKAIRFDYPFNSPFSPRDEPVRFTLNIPPLVPRPTSNFFPGPSVNRTSKALPLNPSSFNQIPSSQKPTPGNFYYSTTQRPTTSRPVVHNHYHYNDDYYNDYDDGTSPDFSDDYPINHKVEPLKLGGKDTVAPQANRELLDVYQRPSRVLYADSSRPGNNRNPKFSSQSNFRFPAQLNK